MSKDKVAVITLPGNYNYGNRLQAYAVHSIYKREGFSPESLVLRGESRFQSASRRIKGLTGRLQEDDPEKLSSLNRIRAFQSFSRQMPERTVNRTFEIDCSEYVLFSCGSDQVWNPGMVSPGKGDGVLRDLYHKMVNPERISRIVEWYYLGFCPREKRLALAPSLGLDSLEGERARVVERGVRNFDRLSVRESRGAELIKECSGRDAVVICDPTLVLFPMEWRAVADDRLTPEKPYVFTYLLGGVGESASHVINEVTDCGRLPVIPLSDRQKPEEPDAGPAEFVSLIDSAVHVVTDSFHAAVFSSILQTPLTIVRREGGVGMFSRLESLAKTLGIERKIYGSIDFDLSCAGDYDGVPEAIERERKKFMDYLEGCLDAQLTGWRDDARA